MVHKSATSLIAAALVSVPMIAAAASSTDRPSFDKADANGDGAVSIEEAKAVGVPKAEAKREDIDNNGKLTKADWKFVDMDGKTGSSSASS